ncbi:MAG: tyrosine-type recombinase/integrase [Acidobacteria bacterium]|nr:tyrosine-type recombinase/integrase [Acidobacteriota bacterium]
MATRRGRGEGSITKRADGRWMARVDLGWQDGKRRRKAVYGRTRREVQDKLRETMQRVAHDLPPLPEQETVEAYLRRWLELRRDELRPHTYISYEQTVRRHLVPGLGRVRLSKLGPRDVATWLHSCRLQGIGLRTIQYSRSVLRAALNQALRWELVSRNAAALTPAPQHKAREIKPLTPDEAKQLLAAVAGHRLEALITVAVGLGLRRGEALALRWDDVDLTAGVLSVRHTLERAGGDTVARKPLLAERARLRAQLKAATDDEARRRLAAGIEEVQRRLKPVQTTVRLAEPKTARSRRTITLPDLVASALRAHRSRQLEERLAAGARWQDTGLVFTTGIGTAVGTHSLHATFKGMLCAAGLPDIRYHDLRHTAATLLLAQGVDVRTIMETLGHAQVSLTLNTYAHVVPALRREAAARMDAILSR